MKQQYITHSGIVTSISEERIYVTIKSESACASCHAKGACSMSEQVDKIVDVAAKDYPQVAVGDTLEVVISKESGVFAVVIAYIIPIVLILASLYLFNAIGLSEPVSGLLMLCLIAFYFIIIYLLRKKIVSKINISIKI